MKRLQANLAYLAGVADKKASVAVPKGPQFLTAPPLNLSINIKEAPSSNPEESTSPRLDPATDRKERDKYLNKAVKSLEK